MEISGLKTVLAKNFPTRERLLGNAPRIRPLVHQQIALFVLFVLFVVKKYFGCFTSRFDSFHLPPQKIDLSSECDRWEMIQL